MLEARGIRKGVEVFVRNPEEPDMPVRKGRVIRTYPHPSQWLVIRFEDGDMAQIEARFVTTMYEKINIPGFY